MESDCLSSCTQYNSNCRRRCAVNSNWCVEIYLWFHQCFLKTAKAYIISFLMWFDRYLVVTILWDRVFAMIPALIIPFFFFDICTPMFITVLSKGQKQPQPPISRWMGEKDVVHLYNECIQPWERGIDILPLTATWIGFEHSILSEMNQTKRKVLLWYHLYMEPKNIKPVKFKAAESKWWLAGHGEWGRRALVFKGATCNR